MIGQWLHQQILRRHLEHLGCRVEFGSTLQAIEQKDDGVVARLLKTKDGEELEETARFAYVVGADGAHSKFHSFFTPWYNLIMFRQVRSGSHSILTSSVNRVIQEFILSTLVSTACRRREKQV